jgi:3-oxo-5alpha-steroid 4-dehydrogenase
MQRLLAAVAREPLRTLVDVRVDALVQDDADARVLGVVGVQAGQTLHLRARRGVVLCAGGFVMNDEMLRRHAPQLLRCNVRNGVDGDDGRGIRLGQAAGARRCAWASARSRCPRRSQTGSGAGST